jgi:hypothetical protein
MGGGGTETTTQTSGPTNPAVDATTTKLLTNLQGQVDKGTAVFDQSLNPGAGSTTQNSWASMLGASNNPDYSRGVAGATSDFADIAAGKRFGMNDPGYAAMRAGALDDAMTGVGSSFLTDGRFGSSVMGEAAGKAATQTLAGLDYQNFQNDQQRQERAAGMLPDLYSAAMAPSGVQAGVGAAQDANALALRQADNDLFRRRNDAGWSTLGNASSILAGTAGAGTQQQSTTEPTAPWWQTMLGAGAIGSGIYKNMR